MDDSSARYLAAALWNCQQLRTSNIKDAFDDDDGDLGLDVDLGSCGLGSSFVKALEQQQQQQQQQHCSSGLIKCGSMIRLNLAGT